MATLCNRSEEYEHRGELLISTELALSNWPGSYNASIFARAILELVHVIE